jgi:two-component system OmpR family response regulator
MDAQQPHLLIVDDDREIRDSLARYLTKNGYRVSAADGGAAMKRVLAAGAIDLVILDVMMPGEDGLTLCRYLRETTRLPIVMLTAVGEQTDRIIGLEMGADDYIVKPFNPRELLARIRAVIRRTHSLPPEQTTPASGLVKFSGLSLDLARHELTGVDGVAMPLSQGEFTLLVAFIDHPGRVLTRDQLLDLTRGRAAIPFDRSIDNQVSRLRRKIEPDPKSPILIQTVWGGGYRFTPEVTRDEVERSQ